MLEAFPDNLVIRVLWAVVGLAVVLHWAEGVVGAMEELDEEQEAKKEESREDRDSIDVEM